MTAQTAAHYGDSSEFARSFERTWRAPTPEALVALLSDEVILRQPTVPTIRGKAAALIDFRRLLNWLPRLHARIDRTWTIGDNVVIEYRLVVPIGRGFELPIVDTFELKDGFGVTRTAYFDRGPIVKAVLTHPWMVWGFLRYRFGF